MKYNIWISYDDMDIESEIIDTVDTEAEAAKMVSDYLRGMDDSVSIWYE